MTEEIDSFRDEIKSMSFEELMKLKEQLGSRDYNEAVFGESSSKRRPKVKTDLKRLNKNRPREMSSKSCVPFLGHTERKQVEKTICDPRFEGEAGEYDAKKFKEDYSFLNEIRETEAKDLKAKLRETVDPEEKKTIKLLIQRLENKIREEKKWRLKEDAKKEEAKAVREARESGKTHIYMSKKEKKTKELVKKFEDLKKSGGLDKHLEKKRKKHTAKDRKKMHTSF
ncbi:RRP36 family protein [Megaselia abdita]